MWETCLGFLFIDLQIHTIWEANCQDDFMMSWQNKK